MLRRISLGCCALLVGVLCAQEKPAEERPVKLDPTNELDKVLMQWEQRMTKLRSFAAVCNRTETNPVFATKDEFFGTIHFLKPNYVLFDMAKKDDPENFERFISSGNKLYRYVPALKQIEVYRQPGKAKDDGPLALLFGMKAIDAKKRYDIKLVKKKPEDKNFIYLDIDPVLPIDKAELQRARLVLNRSSMLPRQILLIHPTKAVAKWDFPVIQESPKLVKSDFDPKVHEGWKIVPKKP